MLSGAGISAESGVPTFRDALTGLWARFDPRQLATEEAFRRQPQLVWDWYAERRVAVGQVRPNAALAAAQEAAEDCDLIPEASALDGVVTRCLRATAASALPALLGEA